MLSNWDVSYNSRNECVCVCIFSHYRHNVRQITVIKLINYYVNCYTLIAGKQRVHVGELSTVFILLLVLERWVRYCILYYTGFGNFVQSTVYCVMFLESENGKYYCCSGVSVDVKFYIFNITAALSKYIFHWYIKMVAVRILNVLSYFIQVLNYLKYLRPLY